MEMNIKENKLREGAYLKHLTEVQVMLRVCITNNETALYRRVCNGVSKKCRFVLFAHLK
jgi:hypothetical protein